MAISLFDHEAIRTTEAKAKELRPFVEKLITMARKGTVHARRVVSAELGNRRGARGVLRDREEKELDQGVIEKLFSVIAPRYAERPGGYTRIVRLAERRIGDAGKQVLLQLVEEAPGEGVAPPGASRRERRAARRAAAQAAEAPAETPPAATDDDSEAPAEPPAPEAEASEAEAPEETEATDEDEGGGEKKKD